MNYSKEWHEGYVAYEEMKSWNPYCHWEGYEGGEQWCLDWQAGYETAKQDYESETY